jgi:hypothetical protein
MVGGESSFNLTPSFGVGDLRGSFGDARAAVGGRVAFGGFLSVRTLVIDCCCCKSSSSSS